MKRVLAIALALTWGLGVPGLALGAAVGAPSIVSPKEGVAYMTADPLPLTLQMPAGVVVEGNHFINLNVEWQHRPSGSSTWVTEKTELIDWMPWVPTDYYVWAKTFNKIGDWRVRVRIDALSLTLVGGDSATWSAWRQFKFIGSMTTPFNPNSVPKFLEPVADQVLKNDVPVKLAIQVPKWPDGHWAGVDLEWRFMPTDLKTPTPGQPGTGTPQNVNPFIVSYNSPVLEEGVPQSKFGNKIGMWSVRARRTRSNDNPNDYGPWSAWHRFYIVAATPTTQSTGLTLKSPTWAHQFYQVPVEIVVERPKGQPEPAVHLEWQCRDGDAFKTVLVGVAPSTLTWNTAADPSVDRAQGQLAYASFTAFGQYRIRAGQSKNGPWTPWTMFWVVNAEPGSKTGGSATGGACTGVATPQAFKAIEPKAPGQKQSWNEAGPAAPMIAKAPAASTPTPPVRGGASEVLNMKVHQLGERLKALERDKPGTCRACGDLAKRLDALRRQAGAATTPAQGQQLMLEADKLGSDIGRLEAARGVPAVQDPRAPERSRTPPATR